MSGRRTWWPGSRGRRQPDPDPAASMALLREVLDPPTDPAYSDAAAARQARGLPAATPSHSPLLVCFALLVGFLATVAVLQLRTPDPAAAQNRAALIERVEAAAAHGDELAEQIDVLRAEISSLEQAAATGEDQQPGADPLTDQLRSASVSAGTVAMQGPGVRITLDDAPSDYGEEPTTAENRVLAHDLQVVVNGLWSSGAEAISVNGQRLTTTSSIRYAGEAIVVDFRGLARPYVIEAIGPTDAMAAELSDGGTGEYIASLRSTYGLSIDGTSEPMLTVPAATRATIRVAHLMDVIDEDDRGDGADRGDGVPRDATTGDGARTEEP